MLGGNDHGVQLHGLVVLVISEGHLGLAIRAQAGDDVRVAHFGEPASQAVSQGDRQGHELCGLIGGITEHETLIARAQLVIRIQRAGGILAVLDRGIHASADLWGLLADGYTHATGLAVESHVRAGEPNARQGVAHDLRDFHVCAGAHLAHYLH